MTIRRSRLQAEKLLREDPSLQPQTAKFVAEEMETGRRLAEISFEEYGETPRTDPHKLAYSKEQVLGEWFPDQA